MASTSTRHPNCAGCQGEGRAACKGCLLVTYCGRNCQKGHWPEHKTHCKSPLMKDDWQPNWAAEHRQPTFMVDSDFSMHGCGGLKYLWGNVPALDVIQLQGNEGVGYQQELRVLFAASGDLRNVIKSIASLPQGYTHTVSAVINDRDFDIVARNIIMLLAALVVEDNAEAVECMLHLWYSACIRQVDADILMKDIRPLIDDVVRKIAAKPPEAFLGKTFTIGAHALRIELPKKMWNALLSYFQVPESLSEDETKSIRTAVSMAPSRIDYRERQLLAQQLPAHRVGAFRFREDGILLPFGHSREAFIIPNPTLFQTKNWPMPDSADPLYGWNLTEISQTDIGPANNDTYGKLYAHVWKSLLSFRGSLTERDCKFRMLHMDAIRLPEHLRGTDFARIEVSNACDDAYLGTWRTVDLFGPLLQSPKENKCATLIGLYMNAVEEVAQMTADPTTNRADARRVLQYDPLTKPPQSEYDPGSCLLMAGMSLVGNFDKYFDLYMKTHDFKEMENEIGMAVKAKHTIIDKWPMQLKLRPGEPGAREEFILLRSSGHSGQERYVEWQRTA